LTRADDDRWSGKMIWNDEHSSHGAALRAAPATGSRADMPRVHVAPRSAAVRDQRRRRHLPLCCDGENGASAHAPALAAEQLDVADHLDAVLLRDTRQCGADGERTPAEVQ